MFTVNPLDLKLTDSQFLFQNISCLRLILTCAGVKYIPFKISKHFMFTVNTAVAEKKPKTILFQNISCLRLIECQFQIGYKGLIFQNISCLRLIA